MIKMLKPTSYNGKSYKCGDECKEDANTIKRWIENRIAEQVNNDIFDEQPIRKRKPKIDKTEQGAE